MPYAYADTSHRPAYASTWIGLGGCNGTNKLVQAGTESTVLADGSGRYNVWWEILNTSISNDQQNITNFTFSPGDEFYCDINVRPNFPSTGKARASFYIFDRTSNAVTSFYRDITDYSGVTNFADWITERFDVDGSIADNFANVGDVHMWNCGSSSSYNGSVALIDNASANIWYDSIKSLDDQRYLGTPGTIGSQGNFIFSWKNYF